MSLAARVIGTILFDGGTGQVVHREGFRTVERRDSPVSLMQVYVDKAGGFDEILLLDVTAAPQGRDPDFALIRKISDVAFLPIAYGGGVSRLDQASRIISECGAEKVVLGTRIFLIGPISSAHGQQAVVVSVDVHAALNEERLTRFCRYCERAGAGEILLQSQDRDGRLSGYDLASIRSVCNAVSIPVIASSGCGKPEDMVDALAAGATAVAAGWMWDATGVVPLDCKRAMKEAGYVVRIAQRHPAN